MKDDTMELVDYVRIIWKRKVIVIVVTLVCVIAGVVARMRAPEVLKVYRAVSTIKIGYYLAKDGIPSPVDSTRNLVEYIPKIYALNDAPLYSIEVGHVDRTEIIRIIIEGPDSEGVRKYLKVVVNRLIDDHHRITEKSFQPFIAHLEELNGKSQMLQNDITRLKEKYGNLDTGKDGIAVVNLLQSNKEFLIGVSSKIVHFQTIVNQLEEFKTAEKGRITVESLHVNRNINKIVGAGFAGFMISIFLVLSIEYLGKEVVMEKGKKAEREKDKSNGSC